MSDRAAMVFLRKTIAAPSFGAFFFCHSEHFFIVILSVSEESLD
jgi:hypothetical protein